MGPPQPEDPEASLIQNKELGLGHLVWLVTEVIAQVGAYAALPLETLKPMLRLQVNFPPFQRRTEA